MTCRSINNLYLFTFRDCVARLPVLFINHFASRLFTAARGAGVGAAPAPERGHTKTFRFLGKKYQAHDWRARVRVGRANCAQLVVGARRGLSCCWLASGEDRSPAGGRSPLGAHKALVVPNNRAWRCRRPHRAVCITRAVPTVVAVSVIKYFGALTSERLRAGVVSRWRRCTRRRRRRWRAGGVLGARPRPARARGIAPCPSPSPRSRK